MKPLLSITFVLFVSFIVLLGRFTISGHTLSYDGSYKALAHIWVGVLLVLSWQCGVNTKKNGIGFWNGFLFSAEGFCLWFLTIVEVIMFVYQNYL